MKYKALAAAIALATVNTYALEGRVVNNLGEPIVGAKIKTTTSKKSLLTNDDGQFDIADDVGELHVTAPGYSHRIVHLHERDEQQALIITLSSTVIEQVDVIGLPIHASVIESAMPVAVLSGEALRNQQAATLGDTLERQPGVNTNFHGNVASTPVIRGLSGPRVLVTQNSLDVSDVSRVGPDHAVASEVSTAQQVEILRGPATLFYGSGAIGGVVNVVDQRVPTDPETRGEFLVSHDTVNKQNLASFNATTGTQTWAFYADGFWRDADDYEVPIVPDQEDGHEDMHTEDKTVANSAEESSGFTFGSSYLLDNGYVGVAVERLDREYGIPGHSHGGHADEEERVYAELEQDRYQLQSELTIDSSWLRAMNTRAAYTDYTHAEIEDGVAGTLFSNKTSEVRLDLFHQEWQHWKGGLNFHYKRSDVSAEGEEAFTPPSTSETLAVALMEEKHIGPVLLQLGARAERVTVTADNVLLPALEVHGHEDEDHQDTHAHEEEHGDESTRVFAVEHEFTPVSLSLGAVWDFTPGYNVGIALSHAERAPSASELLSFGPHIGTRSYEVGALFRLHEEEGGDTHFELSTADFNLETSNNIDLTFRKHEGDLGIILNVFFNRISDYYFQQDTGLFGESAHAHEDEHDHGSEAGVEEDEHENELPIFLFTHEDAEFYGLEAQVIWKLNTQWQTTFFSDFVHAELTDGRYLPRTPPMRFGVDLDFTRDRLSANLSWMHYSEQDKVSYLETSTNGYNMLGASATYRLPLNTMDLALFVQAENFNNTEARVHTSFIKDVAPRPGRNFSFGLRGSF